MLYSESSGWLEVGVTTVFRLREVLEQREEPLSLLQLAKRAGLSYGTVHAIYRNNTTRVDLASLDAIAGVPKV